MHFVLSKKHPVRRFWRMFLLKAYRVDNAVVPQRLSRAYWTMISSIPSVLIYAVLYGVLPLVGVHYMVAATLATAVAWGVYFPIVRHRAFDGNGEIRKEGAALLGMYLVATIMQLKLLSVLVEIMNLQYIVAMIIASVGVSSVRFPLTLFIFFLRRKK